MYNHPPKLLHAVLAAEELLKGVQCVRGVATRAIATGESIDWQTEHDRLYALWVTARKQIDPALEFALKVPHDKVRIFGVIKPTVFHAVLAVAEKTLRGLRAAGQIVLAGDPGTVVGPDGESRPAVCVYAEDLVTGYVLRQSDADALDPIADVGLAGVLADIEIEAAKIADRFPAEFPGVEFVVDEPATLEDSLPVATQPNKQAEPKTGAAEDAVVYFRGDGLYTSGRESLRLDDAEANVLQALVELGAATKDQLIRKSGVADAPGVLKKIKKKHSLLDRVIILPGGRGKGGYRTTIKPFNKR